MFIVDTHALLWYLRDSAELSARARDSINEADYVCVSAASLWEIAIKHSIGKLDLDFTLSQIEKLCHEKNISILPIRAKYLDELKNLPKIHNDPFDRLIICQAKVENLAIITRDSIIPQYSVSTVW